MTSEPIEPPDFDETERRRAERRRGSPLSSPRVTAGLALLVVVLLAILIIPNLNLPRVALIVGDPTPTAAPQSSPTAEASASPADSPTFRRPTPTPLPSFISHVVKPGESLISIAAIYSTKARSIAWWNRGTYPTLDPESAQYNPGQIEVGWTLVLMPGAVVDEEHPPSPSPGRATATPAASAAPTSSPASTQAGSSPSPLASH